jgi:transposase-like protein
MVRPGRERLSDLIQVDETYLGAPKPGKRGRGAAGKTLVMIATEIKGNKIGRIRLYRLKDASSKSLNIALAELTEPGSVIQTDGWSGYSNLNDISLSHMVVRENFNVGDELLPHVHRVASLLKRWLLGTYQGAVKSSHLDYYLDEFTFRFNRRTSRSRGKLFYRLVQQALTVNPVKGSQLKARHEDDLTPRLAFLPFSVLCCNQLIFEGYLNRHSHLDTRGLWRSRHRRI